MKGARDYATLIKTGQHGRLYFVSGAHARGKRFHIFVLPKDEIAVSNGNNGPLNKNAVEVYGVISGQVGWTEEYGWLHNGPWQADFINFYNQKLYEYDQAIKAIEEEKIKIEVSEKNRFLELLRDYQLDSN